MLQKTAQMQEQRNIWKVAIKGVKKVVRAAKAYKKLSYKLETKDGGKDIYIRLQNQEKENQRFRLYIYKIKIKNFGQTRQD